MFTLFEGPDGAGKSHIAYALARKTDAFLINCGPPPIGKAKTVWSELLTFAEYSTAPVVCDRLHWGDYVYGTLFRVSELGIPGIIDMNKRITEMGGQIVYVRAEAKVLNKRIDDRGVERSKYEDRNKLAKVVELYDEVFAESLRCGANTITLNNDFFLDTEWVTEFLVERVS